MEPNLHHVSVILILCLMLTLSTISKVLERGADIDYFFQHRKDNSFVDSTHQLDVSTKNLMPFENYSNSWKPFVEQTPMEEIISYSKKFRKLKFSLQDWQLRALAYNVKHLYEKDKIALFFVSAYFIRACELLEKERVNSIDITRRIKRKIKALMDMTSIETFRKQQFGDTPVNVTSQFWKSIESEVQEMTPKTFGLTSNYKDQQIEDIIFEMVGEAKKKFSLFYYLTSTVCSEHNALAHHINFKIKSRSELPQLKRVKEKLLRNYFKIYGDVCLNTFWSIAEKRQIQQVGFDNILQKVYKHLEEVPFIVKDILRAKCMFNTVSDIKQAADQIVGLIHKLQGEDKNIKLVEFENRLNKITCDIMLIVQIDHMFYEIQLSLSFDESLFDISHKMYEISRSKVFSPIVLLFEWFEKIAPEFLYKVGHWLAEQTEWQVRGQQDGELLKLKRQYDLLNQFFHLSTYQNLEDVSEEQFSKEIEEELSRVKEDIIQPFVEIGPTNEL